MNDLTDISLSDLETLLRLVQRGNLYVPLSPESIMAANLRSITPALPFFKAFTREGLVKLLQATIAERKKRRGPEIELVWTGPESPDSTMRDTYVVVQQLFEGAKSSVLVAGYSFDHGKDILKPLYEAMNQRSVKVDMFLDLRERANTKQELEGFAEKCVQTFIKYNWPFGSPLPSIHYNPKAIRPGATTSIHAKCVVVDMAQVFITSANFTDRGQTRNVEAGLLVRDPTTAERLTKSWKSLLTTGEFETHRDH